MPRKENLRADMKKEAIEQACPEAVESIHDNGVCVPFMPGVGIGVLHVHDNSILPGVQFHPEATGDTFSSCIIAPGEYSRAELIQVAVRKSFDPDVGRINGAVRIRSVKSDQRLLRFYFLRTVFDRRIVILVTG